MKFNNYEEVKVILSEKIKAYAEDRAESLKAFFADHPENVTRHLTAARAKAYAEGRLDQTAAERYALKRSTSDIVRRYGKEVNAASLENVPAWIKAEIVYTRSGVCRCNLTAGGGFFVEVEGRAGGWGYDKKSAALCDALGKLPGLVGLLYAADAENVLPGGYDEANAARRESLGYSSGYGPLPYFEGGCGVSCTRNILEKIGYKCTLDRYFDKNGLTVLEFVREEG